MENEIRYYLRQIKEAMTTPSDDKEAFKPQYLITAVKLESGAIELATNTDGILEKIDYILDAYDDDMRLKRNENIVMQNIMIV